MSETLSVQSKCPGLDICWQRLVKKQMSSNTLYAYRCYPVVLYVSAFTRIEVSKYVLQSIWYILLYHSKTEGFILLAVHASYIIFIDLQSNNTSRLRHNSGAKKKKNSKENYAKPQKQLKSFNLGSRFERSKSVLTSSVGNFVVCSLEVFRLREKGQRHKLPIHCTKICVFFRRESKYLRERLLFYLTWCAHHMRC